MSENYSKTFKIRKSSKLQKTQELQQQEQVMNLKDLRLKDVDFVQQSKHILEESDVQTGYINPKEYLNDEENINCYRFPHSSFCGCDNNCLIQSFEQIDVVPGLSYGNFVSGLKSKYLIDAGVTHILNVTSKEYTKKHHYFEYLNIDLHNNTQEDAKKFFRLSNRFIKGALEKNGKVFIHSSDLQLGAVIAMGYLIGVGKLPFKQGLLLVLKGKTEISPHFMKQIESYDLQKMAFVSLQRE